MKGLLLKDFYLAMKHFKSYIVLIFLFALLSVADSSNMFFLFYPSMLCGMIPVNLMAYDERSKWDVYTAVLPFTRAEVVASKYLTGLMGQGIILLLVATANLIRMYVFNALDWQYFMGIMGTMMLLSAVSTAIPLPFIFRNGVEKGRMGYYVMIGLAAAGSGAAAGFFGDEITAISMPALTFPVMTVTAAAIYVLSWWLSVRFYEKRDL